MCPVGNASTANDFVHFYQGRDKENISISIGVVSCFLWLLAFLKSRPQDLFFFARITYILTFYLVLAICVGICVGMYKCI